MMDYLRHLFLPHHSNNYRPKTLHVDFFAFYVIAFLVLGLSMRLVQRVNPDILGFATNIHVDQLIEFTNQKRIESGVQPLKLNPTLSQAAAGKAAHMFKNDYWAHNGPDGTTPWNFINGAGYTYLVAGENLAKNFSDSSGVVEAWMNSPSHRENMLRGQYEDVGFAVVNGILNGEETTLVVQMFGKQLTDASVAPATPPENIIVAQAQAEEAQIQVNQVATPLPVAQVVPESGRVKEVDLGGVSGAIVKRPLFDMGSISKNLFAILSVVLITVLIIDGLYIWRKNIVRVSGKNMAHVLFIVGITGFVYLLSFGSIL